jgi:transcriptional regulator with XRE-family HTH domain
MEHPILNTERLRLCRLRLRLSQARLGTQIGQDQGYISRLERGVVTDITIRTLVRLADTLGVTTDFLLGRPGAAGLEGL